MPSVETGDTGPVLYEGLGHGLYGEDALPAVVEGAIKRYAEFVEGLPDDYARQAITGIAETFGLAIPDASKPDEGELLN